MLRENNQQQGGVLRDHTEYDYCLKSPRHKFLLYKNNDQWWIKAFYFLSIYRYIWSIYSL